MESYKPNHPSQEKAKAGVRRFIEKYPLIDVGLLLLGPCGVGKTHLAVALLKQLIVERGATCLFYGFRELLRDIQASWNNLATNSESEIIRSVLEPEVLVLDELGANKPTDWVRDTVEYVINCRYNDRKITIFTSNYLDHAGRPSAESEGRPLTSLREETLTDRIGTRLRSRLYEMCKVLQIDGKDFRREIKQASYRF